LEDGPFDHLIAQRPSFAGRVQHQRTSAHVPSADKIGRKDRSLAQDLEKQIPILAGCDTTQQNGFAARSDEIFERFRGQPKCSV
jgi:hypothetical protein